MPDQDAVRRALGARLAALRTRLGVTGREFAEIHGWTQPKVSRAENGVNVPPLADIERWLDTCRADPEERKLVMALARTVRTASHDPAALPDVQTPTVRIYETQSVPALLQTPDYARSALLMAGPMTPRSAAARVAACIRRQQPLADGTQDVHALLTETALTWQPGTPDVLVGQLDRLRTLTGRPNVRLGIISAAQQRLAPASGSFTLAQWPDGPVTVTSHTPAGDHLVTHSGAVARYQQMFERQHDHAVYGDQASDLLTRIIDSLK